MISIFNIPGKLNNSGVFSLGSGGYGAAAQAYIDAIEAAGASPTTAEKDAIDVFYSTVDMTLWKRLYMPVWAAAAPNAVDMVDSSRSGTWNGGVTHTAGDAYNDGTTGFFDLGTNPSTAGLGLAETSLVWYKSADSNHACHDMGSWNSNSQMLSLGAFSSVLYFDCANNSTGRISKSSPANLTGVVMGNRKSTTREILTKTSAGITVEVTSSNSDAGTIPTVNMAGMKSNGLSPFKQATDTFSLFGMGLGHTSGQRTTFLNAAYTMLNSFTTHKPTMV